LTEWVVIRGETAAFTFAEGAIYRYELSLFESASANWIAAFPRVTVANRLGGSLRVDIRPRLQELL
jgi:hypothetical protein